MIALSLATAKNVALIIVAALVVVSIVTAKVVASMTKRVIAILIFAALAFGVFTQRQSLQSCADKVRATGGVTRATCTFFGNDITIVEGR